MSNIRKVYRIFVSKLPWTVSKYELKSHFTKYGYVHEANVVFDKKLGLSKGFGFVEFLDKSVYDKVLQESNHIIDEHDIKVQEYKK